MNQGFSEGLQLIQDYELSANPTFHWNSGIATNPRERAYVVVSKHRIEFGIAC